MKGWRPGDGQAVVEAAGAVEAAEHVGEVSLGRAVSAAKNEESKEAEQKLHTSW